MATAATAPPAFNLGDPALLEDPYEVYARIRAAGAITRAGPGQYAVGRHADVAALLRDQRLTKNLPVAYYEFGVGGDEELSGFLARMNLGHRNRLASRLLAKAFSPALARRLAPHMAELVDSLLAPALQGAPFDAVTDLALPFPMMVMCELLGVPTAERDQVWPRAAELVRAFSDVAFLSDKDVSAARVALAWLQDYLGGLLRERRKSLRDDLISRMVTVEENGNTLTDGEIVDNAVTVFYAGFETSMGMISNGLVALMDQPDQLRRWRSEPGLTPRAIEEIIRYEAPIQVTMRAPNEHLTIGDQMVRKGRVIFLLLGSANRDERVFTEPDRLDIGREPNPHLSFGAGIYHCLGAPLARGEGAVFYDRLLATTSEIELAGPPVRRPRFNFRTYDHVPLTVRPR